MFKDLREPARTKFPVNGNAGLLVTTLGRS